MKKRLIGIFALVCLCMLPFKVYATSANSNDWVGTNIYTCTSKYQDANILTSSDVYFSHCMEARCENDKFKLYYYSSNKVTCSNGNTNPYVEKVNSDKCDSLNYCDGGEIKYCSMVLYYDCGRKVNGEKFTTTSKTTSKRTKTTKRTTKRTTKPTTSSTTTTQKIVNTKLESLVLSHGEINFISDILEYTINVTNDVSSINITAIPQDNSSKVEVKNNTNIINGSVISIVVIGIDNSTTEYKINVKKEDLALSSNSNLKSLIVEEYDIDFNKNVRDYNIVLKKEVDKLNISYETEDEKSTVLILNNTDIKDGSKVTVQVTAEDGTKSVYNINVQIKNSSGFIKVLFIIILILAIIAGAYYIYKKFIQSRSGDKYEYE